MKSRRIDRRRFLQAGAGLAGWCALPGAALVSPRFGDGDRTLLIVQLEGGNDGLDTVIPYGDDAYHAGRPTLARKRDEVLVLDDYRGLHPGLERLREEYEAGRLAIVEGAGYPDPIRSHFRSFDVWHAADRRGRQIAEGWVGRLCGVRFAETEDPNLVVHLGNEVPYSLHSPTHPPTSFVRSRSYRWAGDEREVRAYERAVPSAGDERDPGRTSAPSSLDIVRRALVDGQASSDAIRRATARYTTPVEYPIGPFAEALREVAGIVNGAVGTRILSVPLGGFDTHTDEEQRRRSLMRILDGGLGAFLEDMRRTPAGKKLVVMVFSEFGRRPVENGARGTDHGTAAPMLVAGDAVRGGLYGAHPSLTDLDGGDLRHSVDFRSVYATMIAKWFGADAKRVLGAQFPQLPLV